MKAREKANEMVDEYLHLFYSFNYDVAKSFAKRSALISLDQILKAVTTIADKKYDFYVEVKKELENL